MNEMAGQGLSEGSRLTSWDAIPQTQWCLKTCSEVWILRGNMCIQLFSSSLVSHLTSLYEIETRHACLMNSICYSPNGQDFSR